MSPKDTLIKSSQKRGNSYAAVLRRLWQQFSDHVKDPNTACLCLWVDASEARNWRAPKFWKELEHCTVHQKMGRKPDRHGQDWRRLNATPVVIDLGESSDEELFGPVQQEQARTQSSWPRPGDKLDSKSGTARRDNGATVGQRSNYTAHTIATDILRAAGIHPTLPPLNWRTDPCLLDIQQGGKG